MSVGAGGVEDGFFWGLNNVGELGGEWAGE